MSKPTPSLNRTVDQRSDHPSSAEAQPDKTSDAIEPPLAWDLAGAGMPAKNRKKPRLRWRDLPGADFMRRLLLLTFGPWVWVITSKVFAAPGGLPNPGDAVTTYQNATPPGDVSVALFIATLGDIFANPFSSIGTPTTLLGEMFLVFNTFVLSAGVIWATYGLGTAAVQTAHEGQFMGKRLSQIWMPIRMTMGVAGLIPSFGGFSLSQVVLLFSMSIGIGGANLAYRAMIDATNGMKSVVAPTLVSPKAAGGSLVDASYALFRSRVCFRAMQHYGMQQGLVAAQAQADVFRPITSTGAGILDSMGYGTTGAPAACGSVKITANSDWSRASSSVVGFRVASVNYDGIADSMLTRARTAFPQLVAAVDKLADTWYDGWIAFDKTKNSVRPAMPYAQLQGLATGYYSAASGSQGTIAAQQSALTSSAIAEMKRFGWFGAGAWYATIAEVNAGVMQSAQAVSFTVTQPTGGERYNNSHWQAVAATLDNAEQQAASGSTGSSLPGAASPGHALCDFVVLGLAGPKSTATGNCSWGQNVAMFLIDHSAAGSGGASAAKNGLRLVDPIIAMKNMGDYLMTGAASMYVAMSEIEEFGGGLASKSAATKASGVVTEWVGKAVKNTPAGLVLRGLAAPLKGLGALLPTIIGALFILGVLMSIWLPLVPFVNWLGGITQYLIIMFTGLAAAPIWAFVHLDTNGEGLGQRTETGYLFLINAFFRPILMLIGFVGAAALMIGLGSFLFWVFPGVMANVQGNSITGAVSVIGYLFVFWILMHTIISHVSALSVQLPDEALAWAGRAVGTNMGRDAEAHNRAMFLTVGRFGQQAMTGMRAGKGTAGVADGAGRQAAIQASRGPKDFR